MKTTIKICGFTQTSDALMIEALSIDFVGINFVPYSPRCVSIERALEIRSTLKHAIPVLIFENEDLGKVLEIAKKMHCTHVQFHGSETIENLAKLPLTVIKAYRFVPDAAELQKALEHVAYVLVDGTRNGQLTDIERAAILPQSVRSKLLIAGGLTAENVGNIIERVRPFGVDSASGVESSPGIKDEKKVRAFVNAIRSASSPTP